MLALSDMQTYFTFFYHVIIFSFNITTFVAALLLFPPKRDVDYDIMKHSNQHGDSVTKIHGLHFPNYIYLSPRKGRERM